MITISIKNADELIKQQKGWLVSKLTKLTGRSDKLVENIVAQEIVKTLRDYGVDAEVNIITGKTDQTTINV
ncbi:hypothetical protein [Kaarinaea lacus]